MKNANILAVVLLVVGLAVGFFGGMQYQKTQRSSLGLTPGQVGNQSGRRFNGQNGNNRPVAGEIISADDKSITVKLQDGSSKIVLVSDSTQINKATSATKSDLKTGERVAVFGTQNSDGSVTAQNIQLNPQSRGGFGSPSATPR